MGSGERRTWYERLRQRWVDRAAQRMFERLSAHPESFRRTPSALAATTVAVLVLAGLAAFLGLLVWGTWHASGAWWVVVVLGWMVALVIRPRAPRLPGDCTILSPADYPGLHAVVGQMAVAVGVPAPRILAVDLDLNAFVMPVGARHRSAMVLGLPLMTLLSWPARLAVIGHELGHLRARDTVRGAVVGAALESVAGLHSVLLPSDEDLHMVDRSDYPVIEENVGYAAVVARGIQTVLAAPFLLLLMALDRLSLAGRQHQEYLADRRAAEVVGTEAAVEYFYLDLEGVVTEAAAAVRRGEDPFEHLASRPPMSPERREKRLRELGASPRRADATHPPDDLRIRLLEAAPRGPGPAAPSDADRARAEQELARLRTAARKEFAQALIHGRRR